TSRSAAAGWRSIPSPGWGQDSPGVPRLVDATRQGGYVETLVDLLTTLQSLVRRGLRAIGGRSELRRIDGPLGHRHRLEGKGDGPPVVLVHGLAGSANGCLRILRPLAQRFSVVYALDLPGNGFSPLPAGGPLDLRAQLEVLHGFLRDVVRTPAFVVGNSL